MSNGSPQPTPIRTLPFRAFDGPMLRRYLRYVMAPLLGCTEFRVLGGKYENNKVITPTAYKSVYAGWFTDISLFVEYAERLKFVSGYICLNPANPSLMARVNQRLGDTKHTTKAEDIQCLRILFLDIDSKRPSGISATDEELALALEVRDKILRENPDLAASALYGMSGNGGWINVLLPNYPNDAEHIKLIADAQATIASRYSTDRVEIDTATKDPSRIGPLPGTMKCKGDHLPERPWRMVTFDGMCGSPLGDDPKDDPKIPPFDLKAWVAANPPPEPPPRPTLPRPQQPLPNGQPSQNGQPQVAWKSRRDAPRHLIVEWAAKYVSAKPFSVCGNRQCEKMAFDVACCLVKGFGLEPYEARPILLQWMAGNPSHVWTDRQVDHKVEEADRIADDRPRGYLLDAEAPPKINQSTFVNHYQNGFANNGGMVGGVNGVGPIFDPNAKPAFTDLGNATRIIRSYSGMIRYCKPYGDWMFYDGCRWLMDDQHQIERISHELNRLVMEEVPPDAVEETQKIYKAWAFRCESKERMSAAISVAKARVTVVPSQLDNDPWALNVLNGTINLRDGSFRPHDSSDMITKMAPVRYDPEAKCPWWDKSILEIMNDDLDTLDFLQRAIGYAATGVIRQHAMFICSGGGSNGKTLVFTTIGSILGDYAIEIDSEQLLQQTHAQHPTGLTDLEGTRLVVAEESDDSKKLAEALVKRLTGGNRIRARKMHKDFYEFPPTHHLFLSTNHRPDIKNTDFGIWRRLKMIPFDVCFVDRVSEDQEFTRLSREKDEMLIHKLAEEKSGILNWILAGVKKWQERGLVEPDAISNATKLYREEQDILGWFLDERCVRDDNVKTPTKLLMDAYELWCKSVGNPVPGIKKFGSQLSDKGFKYKKSNGATCRQGIRLKTSAELQQDLGLEPEKPEDREWDFDEIQ